MLKRAFFLVSILALLTAGTACTVDRLENPYATPPTGLHVQAMNRTQIEILDKTQGAGTTSMVGLWPLPLWWTYSDDGTWVMWGTSMTKKSSNIARNRAITIVPRADDLFDPIVEYKRLNAIWFKTVTTTVKGKAIVIKTDDECKASGGNCWSSIMPITTHDLKP